jgi:tetratricopeptide (TPR) repeat protein
LKARPAKPRSSRRPETTPPDAALPNSPLRRWLFRLAAAVLVPAILLGAAEAVLRLAGYGYNPAFFQKLRIGERDYFVNNDAFSSRFFPPAVQRFPGVVRIETPKPAEVFRIFILGESAAMGDPSPAFGAGRYLEVLLRERFPGQKFEVVNVAFTAINSHVVLPIARDCANQQGDVWVLYLGNNEMVGPFGAATVFGTQAPPLGFVRLTLALQKTRLGQGIVALGRKLNRNAPTAASWRGMEMFVENQLPPQDPRREAVFRSFEANLRDIVRAGLDSGAKVLLNTVAVNLRDCPPFASLPSTDLPPAERVSWGASFTNALAAQSRGQWASAIEHFSAAARLDARVADLQYHWAECLWNTGDLTGARVHFQRACDADALCFRATSQINAAIREAATNQPGVMLLDAAALLATNNPAGVCGSESFYEHVHFNFDGNYRLARAWASEIERFLPETAKAQSSAGWAPQVIGERWLGLTDWNRSFVIQSVLRRLHEPPLSSQPNNAARLAALETQEATLRTRMTPVAAVKAHAELADAVKRSPGDAQLVENFADFLEATGDWVAAIEQRQRVTQLLPHDCFSAFQLGRLLAKQGRIADAAVLLAKAVAVRPSLTEAWFELGNLHASQGRFDRALSPYERASETRPQDPMLDCCVAKSLVRLGRRAEGIARYRRAIEKRPSYWEARYELGGELTQAERITEAQIEYEQVVRLNPGLALGHFNLGVILARQSRWDEARREFEETLRLQPDHQEARDYLTRVLALGAGKG